MSEILLFFTLANLLGGVGVVCLTTVTFYLGRRLYHQRQLQLEGYRTAPQLTAAGIAGAMKLTAANKMRVISVNEVDRSEDLLVVVKHGTGADAEHVSYRGHGKRWYGYPEASLINKRVTELLCETEQAHDWTSTTSGRLR